MNPPRTEYSVRMVRSNGTLEFSTSLNGDPVDCLARESTLIAMAGEGRASLVCSSWVDPVVVLGYAQPSEDVDLEFCRDRGIRVLRRISGGTGVLHVRDLSVALALSTGHQWARGIAAGYEGFLDALEPALRSAGAEVERLAGKAPGFRERSPICFEDQLSETLAVGGKKAVGCAQARRAEGVLIHAAVLMQLDAELYARVFGVDEERVSRGLAPIAIDLDVASLSRMLASAFAESLGLDVAEGEPQDPRPVDLALYEDPRWSPLGEAGGDTAGLNCSK